MTNHKRSKALIIALVLIIILTTGCKPGIADSTSQTGISSAIQNSDLNLLAQAAFEEGLNDQSMTGSPAANLAEQDMKSFIRDNGGARAVLGDQADAVFQQIDAAEITIVANMMDQITVQSPSASHPSSTGTSPVRVMVRNFNSPPSSQPFHGTMQILAFLATVPLLMPNQSGEGNQASELPPYETDEKISEGVNAHLSLHPSLNGSKMDIDVEMTVSVSGPPAYTETTSSKLSIDVCPDAQGNVPMTIKIKNGYSVVGRGSQYDVTINAIGRVNDEGRLSSIDIQSQSGTGVQEGNSGNYVEQKIAYTVGISAENKAQNGGISNFSYELVRASSQATQEFEKAAAISLTDLSVSLGIVTMQVAEKLWTEGYCVKIRVPDIENGSKLVQPNSETPFTATVWHKFDAEDLNVPVIATLASGKVSIEPSGNKVPAPAAFLYKAPGENGTTATVHLETRSKRGIDERDLTFSIGGYELEFDSTIIMNTFTPFGKGPVNVTRHVYALVQLEWSEKDQAYIGEAPLEFILLDVPPIIAIGGDSGPTDPCPNEISASGGTFRVINLKISADPSSTQSGASTAAGLELTIDPGTTVETITPVCPPPFTLPPEFNLPISNWTAQFAADHNSEAVAIGGPFIIKGWTAGSENVVAIKKYESETSTLGTITVHENTTLTLIQK